MANIIYNIPSFMLFILMCITYILVSSIFTKLSHTFIPLKFRYNENAAIISISALIGIMYAVLLGFIVLYQLDNFNKVDEAEQSEAKALFEVYRTATRLPEPYSSDIKRLSLEYAHYVIYQEWPMMARGNSNDKKGVALIETISNKIRTVSAISQQKMDSSLYEAVRILSLNTNSLFDDHQERMEKTHNIISPNIWFVIILGSLLTIMINSILGMEFRLHLVCITSISLMIAAVLYLIITLDRPYRGDFSIQPRTFISTVEYITQKPHDDGQN